MTRRLFLRLSRQITQYEGRPVAIRQAVQLLVQNSAQLPPGGFSARVGGRIANPSYPSFPQGDSRGHKAPSRSICPGFHRDPIRYPVKPAADRVPFANRPRFVQQNEKGRLEGIVPIRLLV